MLASDAMIESFVDLTYRGLPLGRRIKLTQVRPASGYLELPAPMPVGTRISIATDEGHHISAVVAAIKEQVAGAEAAPGMKIVPQLDQDKLKSWWSARVALPAEEPVEIPSRDKPVTVRPRSETVQDAPRGEPQADVAAALKQVVEAAAVTPPPGGATKIMPAVDQELLAQLTKGENIELFSTGEHAVVDDGNRTVVMGAMDPSALGISEESGPTRADTEGDTPKSPSPKKRRSRKKM